MTSIHQNDASIYYYGFLSSNVSGVLKASSVIEYIPTESKCMIADALALVQDVITAQKMFAAEIDAAAPSERGLDVFGCALEVILAHKESFGVKDIRELTTLFDTIKDTLQKLVEGGEAPSDAALTKTRMFFKHLAEHMLAQLSAPEEQTLSAA